MKTIEAIANVYNGNDTHIRHDFSTAELDRSFQICTDNFCPRGMILLAATRTYRAAIDVGLKFAKKKPPLVSRGHGDPVHQ